MQLFKEPEEVSDFGAYSRIENKQPIKEEVARRSPALLALHARLGLDKDKFAYSTLAQALICRSATTGFADNLGMASFGKNLLSFYVYEYFMVKYPRLPPSILRHVVNLYTSEAELYRIGSNMGVEVDTRPPLARYLAEETDEDLIGKLIFQANTVKREGGVVELLQSEEEFRINHTKAMASFVRALVAGVYAHHGLEQAREYIHNYIIKPHKIDMASLIAFEQPTRELAVLCAREGLKNPVSRLMMETGRFSKSPVFVVGVFSGKSKLG
jgi:dsRNA-specific ribonuclease